MLHLAANAMPPEPPPAPEPGMAPAPSPPITPPEVPKKSRRVSIAILLVAIVAGAAGFAYVYTQTNFLRSPSSAATKPNSGYNTYSNHGFSFQYVKGWTISESGIVDSTADSGSGIVTARNLNNFYEEVFVAWIHSSSAIDPTTVVPSAIDGFQRGSRGTGLTTGQPGTTTTKAGYSAYDESFSITISGTHENGVWSAWYSTQGQRLYQLGVVTSGQDATTLFNTSLSSVIEL